MKQLLAYWVAETKLAPDAREVSITYRVPGADCGKSGSGARSALAKSVGTAPRGKGYRAFPQIGLRSQELHLAQEMPGEYQAHQPSRGDYAGGGGQDQDHAEGHRTAASAALPSCHLPDLHPDGFDDVCRSRRRRPLRAVLLDRSDGHARGSEQSWRSRRSAHA